MKTEKLASFLFVFLLMILLPGLVGCSGKVAEETPEKPNIVLILGDDMKTSDFGFIKGEALTPNMDRLAKEGFFFPRTYVPSAACTPTRFSCLTGRFASNCQSPNFVNSATPEGVYAVSWNTDLTHEPDILSRTMKEAGYVTGMTGKWHNGASEEFGRIWRTLKYDDDPEDPAVAQKLKDANEALKDHLKSLGFDYVEGPVNSNYGGHKLGALRYHNQEEITKSAVDFIRQNKDNPFFLYVPTTLMHGPDPWASLNADPRKTFSGLMDEPIEIQPSREDVIARGKAAGIDERAIGATWLDDGIGVIIKTLEELGLSENTMVIFMDDQGMDGGKGSCFEGGVRVPSMVYWPGTIKPGRNESLVANIDWYSTICEVCGIGIDESKQDGQSIWPILTGEKEKIREVMYCEWAYSRAIVSDEWKYLAFRLPPSKDMTYEEKVENQIREAARKKALHSGPYEPMPDEPISHMGFPGGQGTERGNPVKNYPHYYDHDQLYNLKNDPGEQVNLASDPQYAEKLAEMKALLGEWVEKMPGTFGEF